jgi:hypothetical protein
MTTQRFGVTMFSVSENDYDLLQTNLLKGAVRIEIMKNKLFKYCDLIEGRFDSEQEAFEYGNKFENALSDEDYLEYIDTAEYMAKEFGRVNNRVKHVKEWMNRLPY